MTTTNKKGAAKFHKPIRSFVLRAGRLTAGQARAMEELWPLYGVAAERQNLVFPELFGREAPVTLEIGIGNGENLVAMAAADQGQNYVGIEVHRPGVGHCLLQIADRQLENVRLLQDDAIEVLRQRVSDHSLARLNLFFPDPWHKKRHHKRRIVQPAFLDLLATKLASGGLFHVATDWPNYAEHIAELMQADQRFIPTTAPADRIETRFDARGQRLGHSNWDAAWTLRA